MLITWSQSSVSVEVGQSVTVSFTTGQDYELMRDISTSDSSVATISTTGREFSGVATIVGVSVGTVTTVPGGSDTQNTPLTITVTAPAPVEDDEFLNKRGLTHFWENIDELKLDTNGNAYRTLSIPYGECNSTSTSTVYTATVPGITELRDGVCMWLKNGVVTSVAGFTINVNGLGAKPVYNNMGEASRETTVWNKAYTMLFVYDSERVAGGCWVLYRGHFSDANSIGYQIRTNSSTLPAKQTGYRYRLWLTSADGQNYVPINTATGTSTTSTKALNTTTLIDPFGTIVYNSTNGTTTADANLPTGTQWTQYVLDMRYAKYPLTLTYPDPVYLQCTPQSTGGALINDIVQALPATDDGKIYIYLGNAYSATNMELKQCHPVYHYKDGAIRIWTNAQTDGSVTVDSALSSTSENPVQNKVIYNAIGDVESILSTLNIGGGAQ